MRKIDKTRNFFASRKRLSELRERREEEASLPIRYSRSTILINVAILIASGVIFAVGLFYIIRFLGLQKPHMEPVQYKIYIFAIASIACAWSVYLFIKIRSYYRLFRRISPAKRD